MRNGKGTMIAMIVIAAVILLGLLLWWSQHSNPSGTVSGTVSTNPSVVASSTTGDTTSDIQNQLDKVDTGSTTEDSLSESLPPHSDLSQKSLPQPFGASRLRLPPRS